jgi:prepilin-type N-terminal cleavage/methylation domain-containing protein
MIVARHHSRWHNTSGYSLVEMLVTIVLFSLVTGSITAVVIATLQHQRSLSQRGSVLASTRNALEQVDRDIRSANPLCAASRTQLTMFESAPTPKIVTYQVSGTDLIYREYTPVVTSGSPVCTVSTIHGATTTTTLYTIAAGSPLSHRYVLRNLVSPTQVFSLPPASTNFATCPTNGADPSSQTVSQISALTVSVSVKTAALKTPVAVSDCGTYLRNYNIVPTT